MERLLNLKELGTRLKTVDLMIMQLALRRMDLAGQVEKYKRTTGEAIFRSGIEDQRIAEVRDWAATHGLNPHFAESLLYQLIGESCKMQMIQRETDTEGPRTPQTEDQWYEKLKQNLLLLTERWSTSYDKSYEKAHFATQDYLRRESELLMHEIAKLTDTEVMLDLGCATGRISFELADHFDRIIGYDISQHMQSQANHLADERGLQEKVYFECADLEEGIPMPDASVSFAVMNLGTASDMRSIRKVIEEVHRVLKPGGRFFFSFYNRDALIYRWDFLPWQTGLAASVNIHRDSLDVHSTRDDLVGEIIPVFARAYTGKEVELLFSERGMTASQSTYPTVSAILPNELFSTQSDVQETVSAIDAALINSTMGAYIIATGEKSQ